MGQERFYAAAPTRIRLTILIVSAVGFILCFEACRPIALLSLFCVASIVVQSITYKGQDEGGALQVDKIERRKALSHNRFVDLLWTSDVIDEETDADDFSLECLKACDDETSFLVSIGQPGKKQDALVQAINAGLLAFDSADVSIRQIRGHLRVNGTYIVSYFRQPERDRLASMLVPFSELRSEKPSVATLPVGLFSDGSTATMSLLSQNALVAGVPRSGKSVFLSTLICDLCLCDHEKVVVMSPKILDFSSFSNRCLLLSHADEMLSYLLDLGNEAERRKATCLEKGIKKIDDFDDDCPHISVIVDEFTVIRSFTQLDDKGKKRKIGVEIEDAIMRLVAETGFAGISFVLATQRVSSTNMSTDLRDLISGSRVCFATETQESTRMVFGDHTSLAPCHLLNTSHRGVGYIATGGEPPRIFKSGIASKEEERASACGRCDHL